MHVPWNHALGTNKINIGVLDSSDKIIIIFLEPGTAFSLVVFSNFNGTFIFELSFCKEFIVL